MKTAIKYSVQARLTHPTMREKMAINFRKRKTIRSFLVTFLAVAIRTIFYCGHGYGLEETKVNFTRKIVS